MTKATFNKATKVGNEPEWDLSAFYKSPTDPQIEKDIQALDAAKTAFAEKYKGNVADLSAAELLVCLQTVDRTATLGSKLGSYASLLKAKNQQKYSGFEKNLSQRLTDIGAKTIFFGLELANIPMKALQDKIAEEPGLELYRVYLEKAVKMQPYNLGEEAETVASKKNMSGSRAWINLFGELQTRTKFMYEGKELGQEEILKLRQNPDRAVREAATNSLYEGLNKELWLRTYITNILSLDHANSDELLHMPGPVEGRNLDNNIDNDIVEAMNQAVNRAYPRVSHRYYELVRKMLDLPKLKGWDRTAPLQTTEEEKIPYEDARKMVVEAYRAFSPLMGDIAQMFFDNGWIDARVTEGKRSGAFSASCSVDTHPAILLNYLGTRRDVATMAHELGHGIHQYLVAHYLKSEIAADTPLTIAETASVFGEMLTFEKLLAQEKDPQKRITLLAGKINDMINTVVRQNAFFNFEKELHATRKKEGRDLTSDKIGDIYLETQKAALGPAFDLDKEYGIEFSYVPHFINSPYYVYAYAFGECLVNSLYSKYQEADDKQAFAEKYIQMLSVGGSKAPADLVKEFGLDLHDPAFWDGGMKPIEDLIDQLEKELAQQPVQAPRAAKKGPAAK